MAKTVGAVTGINKKVPDCYIVTKMNGDGVAISPPITVYVKSTIQLREQLLKLSGFLNRPIYVLDADSQDGYARDKDGNLIINKKASNRDGVLEWDDLGKKDPTGKIKKLKLVGMYYRNDILDYYLQVENVDLCLEYDVELSARIS